MLVVGIVSAGFAYALHEPKATSLRHRKGFTLKTRETTTWPTDHQPTEAEIVSAETTRYQRSDGAFKQVRTYFNAKGLIVKKELLFGIPGQGVFAINNPKGPLIFLSSMPPREKTSFVNVTNGHNHQNFTRDDSVQGHPTYVLRFPSEDGGYVEMYCAPELDGQALRTVSVSPGGTSIEEVTQLIEGDHDNRIFGSLPNLPVNYDLFMRKIAISEEAGKHEVAVAMRRELDEQLARQMPER